MPLTRAPAADADTRVPLPPAPRRTPLLEASTGLVTRAWATWFDLLWKRSGESHAPSNAELDEAAQDQSGQIGQVEDDLAQTSATLAALEAEVDTLQTAYLGTVDALAALTTRVTTLEGQVSTLQTTSADQETRLAALETWKTAMLAALPAGLTNSTGGTADSTVAALAALTATATVTALRDEINSTLLPVLRNNYADVTVASTAIRDALAA